MSNRVFRYNKLQADFRKFYEEDFIVLVIHLITNKIMSMASIAKVLGVTRFAIISRVNRYKSEQEEEEEEEEGCSQCGGETTTYSDNSTDEVYLVTRCLSCGYEE